ncbi:MAG: alanine--tRNA ligase [Dehalococcoidia bacterium]
MAMPPRLSDEIREAFTSFFVERGHVLLPPWPLVPIGDPTTMFTSAGMQQFKPYFMGEQEPPARRVTTVQRSFRTSDIEEVGDYSHLTAFEMLGNFSFGDYFKQEAIAWAWELLTQVYQLPPERLHVTVYLDDDEAYRYWREQGVSDDRIHRCGEESNYWFSGPTGPCGPDSEIFYDYFPERGAPRVKPPDDDDRFLEIWNLVFMTYYQHEDGSRTPLPAKNIDTGSGLERVAAVLQGKRSVFETDIFLPILTAASEVAGIDYAGGKATEQEAYALRAMAEHSRAATLLVGDGVVPSNDGRGYVLRRIVRRAIFLARRIGVHEPFFPRLVDACVEKLKVGYPHLVENRDFIVQALGGEEQRFLRTLSTASARLDHVLERLREEGANQVPGAEAFELYDTYGLPLELTREFAAGEGFTVDEGGFEAALEEQRRRAREHARFFQGETPPLLQSLGTGHSAFTGYTHVEGETKVVAILRGGALVDIVRKGDECDIVLEETPFYPEGGGQMGDRGTIRCAGALVEVTDTQSSGGAILHRGRVREGELRVLDAVTAEVDVRWRSGATRNHTATHILHAALRAILGPHVRQQGSLVAPDRLRFDFTHLEQTPREALIEVQQLANDKVRHDLEVGWRVTSYQQAIASGALAFFGDKYGNDVRVVEIKEDSDVFSAELCGGTHVHHTGELGFVHIVRESAVAAGTRRIEALTGPAAEQHLLEQQQTLQRIAERLSTSPSEVEARLDAMQAELEALRKQVASLERGQTSAITDALVETAREVDGARLVAGRVNVGSRDALKEVADRVRQRLGSAVVVLGAVVEGRPSLLVAATPDLVSRGVNSGDIVRHMATVVGGGGGGRPDLAQAGGKDATKIEQAIKEGEGRAAAALQSTR